jgi:DNA-3-methyladenine glycosylase
MPAPIKAKIMQKRNTAAIARGLLGRVLARRHADGRVTRHLITETEAYHGETDLACHASKGRTARTDVMYRAGGVWYVYLCYGVHEMLNLVTGPEGFPAAVLIRGLAGVSGPGRLTRALGVGRGLNGCSALDARGGLWLEERPAGVPRVSGKWIQTTPRIGVAYAGPAWAGKPWRFVLRMPEA